MSASHMRTDASADRSDVYVHVWPRWRGNPYLVDLMSALRAEGIAVSWASPRQLAQRRRRSVLHVQWPDAIWSGSVKGRLWRLIDVTTLLTCARALGIPIVVTSHNAAAHDSSSDFGARLVRRVLRMASAVIVLRRSGGPEARTVGIPHMDWKNRFSRQEPARVEFWFGCDRGVSPARLVWFGHVRPYKGIVDFARRVQEQEFGDARLLLLGTGAPNDLNGDRVRHHDRRVSDAEIAEALSCADAAIFPFVAIENSGSVFAALATDTPVIAPRMGALDELEQEAGSDWVRLYEPPLDAAKLSALLSRPRPSGSASLGADRRLDQVAQRHVALYRRVLGDV